MPCTCDYNHHSASSIRLSMRHTHMPAAALEAAAAAAAAAQAAPCMAVTACKWIQMTPHRYLPADKAPACMYCTPNESISRPRQCDGSSQRPTEKGHKTQKSSVMQPSTCMKRVLPLQRHATRNAKPPQPPHKAKSLSKDAASQTCSACKMCHGNDT
jgi:hypothetical protein